MRRTAEAMAWLKGWVGRHRRLLVACGAALALYALLGFLVLPRVLHRQLVDRLTALLQREVSVERVRANPFALSVTIEGLLLKQPNGTPGVSWDRLYVNFDLWPLALKEIRFSAISLERPFVELALLRDGTTNLGALIRAFERAGEAPAPEKPPEKSGRPWTLAVDNLAIEGASLAFRDDTRPGPFRSILGPMSVRVQSFHTRADSRSPYSFSGKTESGEGFSWSGTFFIDPLRSQGSFSLDAFRIPKYAPYYQPAVGFEIRDGTASLKASYELEWGAARRVVRIQGGALDLRTLVLALPGAAEPLLELPALEVAGVAADVIGGSAEVDSVTLRDLVLRVRRDRAGQVNLAKAAPPAGEGAAAAKAAGAAPPAEKPAAVAKPPPEPFRYLVKQVALLNGRIDLEDLAPERPVRLDLQKVGVTLGNLSSDPDARSPVEASLLWNGDGRVEVKGEVQANRGRGEVGLRIEGLALAPVDPYLLAYGDLDVRIAGGRLGTDLRLRLDQSGKEPSYEVSGDARIDAFSAADGPRNVELLRWRSLQVAGLRATTRPARTAVRSVTWVEPQVRVQIDQDGSSNVERLRRAPPGEAPAPGPGPEKAPPATGGTSAQASVGSFQILRGRLGFSDRSVSPAVALACTDLEARARGLSTAPDARPEVSVGCKVWGASPLEVSGTLHPRFQGDGTRLTIVSKGIDLTPLGPYAGKHLGYGLEKGKLDLDLGYAVVQRHLDSQNVVRIDQLTLGEKTDSPDATSLPVKLGLAVLRDRDGVILLDVPVSGDVDDPDFRVGRVVWRAIGNVFIKAATAPFALLGSLFGGGAENLDLLEFPPGSAEVDEAGLGKAQVLAKALFERPALQLEIEGTADEAADGAALRRQAVADLVRRAKASAAREPPESVEVPPAEYPRWLQAAYRAAFPGPEKPGPDGKAPPPPTVAQMEARLSASIAVTADDFRQLAAQRAAAARDRILAAAQVDPGRVFLVEGGERAGKGKGARAYFTLR
jgi:hypothetical protein